MEMELMQLYLTDCESFLQQIYNTNEEAIKEVERGRVWGAMIFQKNYSESLVQRTEAGRYATDYTIEASDVDVRMDMSSKFQCPLSDANSRSLR